MKKIAILGCGWLGLPLATSLIDKNFEVSGSTTTADKLRLLETSGINPFLISLSENEIIANITAFLHECNILIINIPPKLRGTDTDNYVVKIEKCIPYIEKSSIEKVIFISSTSVFNDDNSVVTDDSIPNATTEAGKQLFTTEKLLQNNKHFKTTIIRFGGLVGKDRHPSKILAGRTNIDHPDAVINLIHQDDCIEIIQKVIEKNFWNETINAVAPFHPTREAYYQQKTAFFGLPTPTFNHSKPSMGKTVVSNKVTHNLHHQFIYTNMI